MNGRPGQLTALAQALVQRGYVCVVPQYRLSGENRSPQRCTTARRPSGGRAKMPKIQHRSQAHATMRLTGASGRVHGGEQRVKQFEGKGDNRDSSDVQAAVMCGAMNFLEPFIVERQVLGTPQRCRDDFMAAHCRPKCITARFTVTHVSKRTPPMLFIDGEPTSRCATPRFGQDSMS